MYLTISFTAVEPLWLHHLLHELGLSPFDFSIIFSDKHLEQHIYVPILSSTPKWNISWIIIILFETLSTMTCKSFTFLPPINLLICSSNLCQDHVSPFSFSKIGVMLFLPPCGGVLEQWCSVFGIVLIRDKFTFQT